MSFDAQGFTKHAAVDIFFGMAACLEANLIQRQRQADADATDRTMAEWQATVDRQQAIIDRLLIHVGDLQHQVREQSEVLVLLEAERDSAHAYIEDIRHRQTADAA